MVEVNVPKMLVAIGLAPSRTQAERLCKQGAVQVFGPEGWQVWPSVDHAQRIGTTREA